MKTRNLTNSKQAKLKRRVNKKDKDYTLVGDRQ